MTRRQRRLAIPTLALAIAAAVVAASARADGFLGDVEAGRAAAYASAAAMTSDAAARAAATQPDAAARAAATRDVLTAHTPASAGFTIGAVLAALDGDHARDPGTRPAAERALVEQQVRELLAAQAEAGIGNRALCLLSGRTDPKSLERQVRLVEPRWSCDRR